MSRKHCRHPKQHQAAFVLYTQEQRKDLYQIACTWAEKNGKEREIEAWYLTQIEYGERKEIPFEELKTSCIDYLRIHSGAGLVPEGVSAAVSVDDTEPDWNTPCTVCGEVPTLPITGMCGPCTFGEAETLGGNW